MIYLDANATTPIDPDVLAAMVAEFAAGPANASSLHAYGQRARGVLRKAREAVASCVGAKADEVIFTSGGTEAMNALIRGLPAGHVVGCRIDHSCVVKTLREPVTWVGVGAWGAPRVEDVLAAVRPDTVAVVLSWANSETGVKLDVEELARRLTVPLILDAVGIVGREKVAMPPGVAAMAMSAHKFHGPKGVGAMVVRPSLRLQPLMAGGPQERGLRPGTEPLPEIVGMAEALKRAGGNLGALRDRFEAGLSDFAQVNGEGPRVPHVSNLYFPGVDGEGLLIRLDQMGVAASHGSACASGALEPSHVLLGMGYSRERVRQSLRFSLHRFLTAEEVDRAVAIIRTACGRGAT